MRIKFIFAWYDFWVGAFWDAKKRALYIFPIPMFGVRIRIWGRHCYVLRKRGLFYRPGAHGYTDRIEEAGRFTFLEARVHVCHHDDPCDESVTMHHISFFYLYE